jgi:2-oxoglutarate dehydrogenase E1 component
VINSIEDLANGEFQEVIDDVINPKNVKKMVFCMGKFYYDLLAEREQNGREDVALIRIEQLFPLHKEKIQNIIDRYPNVEEYIWAQEEPRNMGAWSYMLQRFELVDLTVRSRNYYAVPAAGSTTRYKKRHQAVIDSVFNK